MLAALLIATIVFATVFFLYSLPMEAVLYASFLTILVFGIFGGIRFLSFYRRRVQLRDLKHSITISGLNLPEPSDRIEQDYQELLQILNQNRTELISERDRTQTEMMDYYTLWVHQIKTPIAAMRLLLQTKDTMSGNDSELAEQFSKNDAELTDQLFKIEQYVEMVLQYLRTESISGDLALRRCPIDTIVKNSVKKYAKSFIRQKISLEYTDPGFEVLTDEKWLTFVIEQVLSNSLKYTKEGKISIYGDEASPRTLVIEDTGIGICPEDLPRIFEKGFTGYNGREDKKSTGIGLYLCNKILRKLSHTISAESEVGKGTRIKIGLDTIHLLQE